MAKAQTKDMDNNPSGDTHKFEADVARLLEIVAHALYSNKDVFLRELISNAADACDRLRYESVENKDLIDGESAFQIRVFCDPGARIVTVMDNGIGMNREELVENLGTIARSGTAALMEQIRKSGGGKDNLSLIGQFGVGFYASFMAADRVSVITRKAGDAQAWFWESDGRTGFTVREATSEEDAQLLHGRGTVITLHVNDDSSEYLIDEKLKEVIKTWSDHINFPVYLGRPKADEEEKEPVNRGSALWARPKSEISDEEYEAFYKHISHGFDEPMMTSHWRAEGVIEFTALMFIPTMRPWDLYDPTRKTATRLYVKRVFITDECEGLVYPWLRFMRGVIDTEDLPLNISREMLQHNPVVTKIRGAVARRVLGDLDKLSESDPEAFATFWGQFGPVLKEGLYDATELREELLKVTRFYSTESENTLASLEDYLSRMKEGQEEIYYISGENTETLKNSPQLEGFRDRGLEVLYFTDTIDDFWLQTVQDYKGKKFISVTKGNIDLSRFDTEDLEAQKDDQDQKDEKQSSVPEIDGFLKRVKEILGDAVGDVRASARLSGSPVCLVAADDSVDLRMERVLKIHQNYQPEAKRVLEVNPKHALIQKLAKLPAGDEALSDGAHLLLDQARIIQGEPVPDPASFARRLSVFMGKGLS